ncbi:aminotransferase class V-fold PLP-dependent enzyme [Engelhardtia mirabilis]|uniref:Isopenicillin N epimerase n=1 Tax=Engelhardtia mirabilis TaxID=2528011 RepID=A0A518BS58_9BACT|nr:Isopenicillin N epimerase [Planctomycetes bacterium Pla133]QDV04126.1 Isopenicillin N epimerase [Planctomycetes bacterium Pla86]
MPGSAHARHWPLDPEVDFLNHGSFGASPRVVLAEQQTWRERMEAGPVKFFARDLEGLLDQVRAVLGPFLGADPDDLALVPNATVGINTILRSMELEPGDELLVTDQEYNASANVLRYVAERAGATVRMVELPFPIASPGDVVQRVLDAVTPATRLLLIDHVTSQTGLIMPVEELVTVLRARGVETLIDGAHAPGMVPLDLDSLGAAYYTGNAHKWLCAPKGSAILHVRRDLQHRVRPLAISHGANSTREDRSRFRIEADWIGTVDPTPWLATPCAIEFLRGLLPGGFRELRAHNRSLVLEGRRLLCEVLEIEPPAPDSMIGSTASVPLPDSHDGRYDQGLWVDPLHRTLVARGIEVPIMAWPKPPRRLLRISGQVYNTPEQYVRLAEELAGLLSSARV